MLMDAPVLAVDRLRKVFGSHVAVDDISFSVPAESIYAVLGPNGAGKTTTINCCTTLLPPDSGTVRVAGFDVRTQGADVRKSIAVTGQFAALDDELTGTENLRLFARLLGLGKRDAAARAAELLDQFGLVEAADRRAKTCSGGMRRRLDLAVSLITDPVVLFLDEPTTGLDPRSRAEVWQVVRGLRERGIAVLLTTQYLEEADQLADRIAVIDHGRLIVEGTAEELKDRIGGSVCVLTLADPVATGPAEHLITEVIGKPSAVDRETGTITVPAPDNAATLAAVLRAVDRAGLEVADIGLRRPSLDDVFFALTQPRPGVVVGGA
jgi:ABC-2 type transport system ATP-binding protein